jgi:hypothetical protein
VATVTKKYNRNAGNLTIIGREQENYGSEEGSDLKIDNKDERKCGEEIW